MLESLFNKVAGLQGWKFIKRRLKHMCFPVNTAKILRTAFYIEHLCWLLLYVLEKVCLVAGFVFISPA